MMNSSKFILFFSVAFFSGFMAASSRAADFLSFDNTGLNVLISNDRLRGYYAKSGNNRDCIFYFQGTGKVSEFKAGDGWRVMKINTFSLGFGQFRYLYRDTGLDLKGAIVREGDKWAIQMEDEPPGCGGAMGTFIKLKDGYPQYFKKKSISAEAIRIVFRKTYFYEIEKRRFIRKRDFAEENTTVIVIEHKNKFSKIRYADPNFFSSNFGSVTTGWVRSADLVDPFPPVTQHENLHDH